MKVGAAERAALGPKARKSQRDGKGHSVTGGGGSKKRGSKR